MSKHVEQTTVKVFVADEQLEMRRLVRTSLQNLKQIEYVEFKDFSSLRRDLAMAYPDLLIIDTGLTGGDVLEMVRSIRHSDFGMNPFVPIVATTWETSSEAIGQTINCGVDAIMLKPLSAGAIVKIVDRLTTKRKEFVVTADYIGPDRRTNPDEGDEEITLIEVPNTLKSKRSGEPVDINALNSWISKELESVNTERLKSNAAEICRILALVLPDYARNKAGERTFGRLERIKTIAEDLASRTRDGEYDHISHLCDNLVKLSFSITANRQDPAKKDLQLIKPLCDAIVAGMDADLDESGVALEIASSIAGV